MSRSATTIESPKIGAPARLAARYWMLNASHTLIDVFPIFFVTLMLPLKRNLGLTDWQVTFIYMATPIFSGLCQPLLAWLSDKHDTRLTGPIGLAMGAVCVASIGFAQDFWQLIALQIMGVVGTGMYHPIATATGAQLGTGLLRNGRAQAIGIFIAFGMVGQTIGSVFAPRVNEAFGSMKPLAWLMIPALVMALAMHLFIGKVKHRHENHAEISASYGPEANRRRWIGVGVLCLQNCLRFTANVGMFVMFNTWALGHITRYGLAGAKDPEDVAAVAAGLMGGAMTVGMGLSVTVTGRFVKRGSERVPLALLSFVGAGAMAAIGYVGDAAVGDRELTLLTMLPALFCVACSAIGFFATFPIATSLAQRLQPGHTSLVTSLMMGVGWGTSALHALLAPVFFGFVAINSAHLLPEWRINLGFVGFAVLLVVAGLLTVFIPRDLFEKAAAHH